MIKLLATLTGAILVTAILVLDPMHWWTWQPPEFQFGEPQLRAAVEGTWELAHDGKTHRFTLAHSGEALQEDPGTFQGMIRAAEACEQRSFVRPAAACYATSRLALAGKLFDTPMVVRAGFHVLGYQFRAGYLDLEIDTIRIGAHVSPDGTVTRIEADKPATLKRTGMLPETLSAR